MNTYAITFTTCDRDTAVVMQPAFDARDAIARVHVVYGHIARDARYSIAYGRIAYTLSAHDARVAAAVARHWKMRARIRPGLVIGGYARPCCAMVAMRARVNGGAL